MSERPVILLVDDEEMILNALRRLLSQENKYDVITALSGAEALERIKEKSVDLIVSDQRMPGMSGLELLQEIKKEQPQAVRILLSGYTDFNVLAEAINEGEIFKFIAKPWDNNRLLSAIDDAFHRRDLSNIISGAVTKVCESLQKDGVVELATDTTSKSLRVKINGDANMIPKESISWVLTLFLNAVFEKKRQEDKEFNFDFTSGMISKDGGTVSMKVDMGKGMSLVVELPLPD